MIGDCWVRPPTAGSPYRVQGPSSAAEPNVPPTPMRLRHLLILCLAAALMLPAAASAASSPGVTAEGLIPEPGVISAKPVGDLLYVSALSGISIYDVSSPRAPVRIGRLELPHSQNEDVDFGNGILLVSDDPFAGRGILYVIDIRDPRKPRLLSTYSTFRLGLLTNPFGREGGRSKRGGIGHTASCIQDCRFAWLAGSPAGIEVVDLRNPAKPRFAGRLPVRPAAGVSTHDVQVDGRGLAWVAGGAGTAAYDTTRPARPRLVTRTDRRGGRGPLNDFIHHNSLRISERTLMITEEDLRSGCRRAGSFQTWEISGRRAKPLDRFAVERDDRARLACSAHYFDHRNGLVAAGFYEQGLRLLDVRDPRRIRQVGFHIPDLAMAWGALFAPTDPTGSTVYVLNHTRGIEIVGLDRAALKPIRRRPTVLRRTPRGGLDVGAFVTDGLGRARRGQRVRIRVEAGRVTGPVARGVAVEARLSSQYSDVRPPRGGSYDPATRTVRYTIPRLKRFSRRSISARVSRQARVGSILEVIAFARAPGDRLPITDRWVDRGRVSRRRGRRDRGRASLAALGAPAPGARARGAPLLLCRPLAGRGPR